ncbi:subtilisin family serine protease [Catenuloplanes nepalensis]|uniref:Subtilisin family serine protease n=1 Tax=Catenuloplanes nepalensis TaxID=587533 RepID=A0ABT9MKS8_9ACTN|nr:S8 family peptidase [Catenuloplanes nepalensis]MDP9792011.1 subtilisin family serine protease [Catenuloplanes nepalensis]
MTIPRTPGRTLAALGLFAAVAAVSLTAGSPASAAPKGEVRYAGADAAIDGSYLVVLKDSTAGAPGTAKARAAVPGTAAGLAAAYGADVRQTWSGALSGFHAGMSAVEAQRLAANPAVAYVEQDQRFSTEATQTNATWGIDRIDQRARPLSTTYTYPNTASNVRAYVLDTGILTTHSQFGGRAVSGYDFVSNDSNATDCNGHGTHVAGTIGGSTYGVAKAVQLVAVRVLDCAGSGTTAGVVNGINWVRTNAVKPAVANMSLGGGVSTTLDNAVTSAISSGITFSLAAGNSNANACNSSPARVASAITVGATTNTDARASYSNYGTCLDIFAPGSSITSAWYTSTSATSTISGTSMAAPHVAGAAALVLSANTSYTPAQVRDYLVNNATPNVVTSPGTGSPNRLLYVVN